MRLFAIAAAALALTFLGARYLALHTTAQEQKMAIAAFYVRVLESDVRGVPSPEVIDQLTPLISSKLRNALWQLMVDQDLHARETQGNEAPLWEDPLFLGSWEGAQRVLDVQREGHDEPIRYAVTLQSPPPYDKDPSTNWKDRLILVQENGKWVVDDVVYQPKSDDSKTLSLSGVFKMVGVDCEEALSQRGMEDCARQNYKREVWQLEKNMAQILKPLGPARQRQFKAAQQTWEQFRKQQCNFDASRYEGGTMETLEYFTCMSDLTQQRNEDLLTMLNDNR